MAQEVPGGGGVVSSPAAVVCPHGLEEIVATFGNIYDYIRTDRSLDAKWQADFLTRIPLPFALRLSWDAGNQVSQMTCHQKLAEVFTHVFQKIASLGLQEKITTFGGCFSFRPQRTGSRLSSHAWGIAVDLNPESNAQGTAGDMDAGVIDVFRGAGFAWGGDWGGRSRDPMHFQFCTGY